MTTKWKPDGLFAGQTVAVLASGPSLTQELADSVRHLPRVCARWAIKRAPDADMCVAVDAPPNEGFWPYALENFKGLKITAVETDALPEVMFWWHRWEMITISEAPSHVIEIRNNGMSAIHLAEEAGAAKILLLGFDPGDPRHFYDDAVGYEGIVGNEWYGGLTKGLEQLVAKLRAQGIEVEHVKTLEDARRHASLEFGLPAVNSFPPMPKVKPARIEDTVETAYPDTDRYPDTGGYHPNDLKFLNRTHRP